jgi:hypothetical protein
MVIDSIFSAYITALGEGHIFYILALPGVAVCAYIFYKISLLA